jgi:hypothetical protein
MMKAYVHAILVLTLATALPAGAQERQTDSKAFRWAGRVPQGAWVRVQNVSGGIHVERATGDQVEITATKSWRRGNPEDVRIEARRFGPNDESVIVCAFWSESATCSDERGYRSEGGERRGGRSNDVSVEFTVRLPAGVRVNVGTVNGEVTVDGATSEVRAGTVNGGIEAYSTGGPVTASTVNGSVRVRMGRLTGSEDLRYATVNGSVIVEFTGDIDADIELTTVNGRLQSDFPLALQGRIDPRHLRATIGKGGRRIRLTTVNGNVELRKR